MERTVVLITGCSSGIGMDVALRLARRSKDPMIVYATMRNLASNERLEQAAGDTLNVNLFIRELDVTKEDTIVNVVEHIMSTHGRLDVLVNNAGIGGISILEATKLATFKKMFETNFFGVVRVTQEVLPLMKKQMSGKIINISSMAGFFGFPCFEMYASTKFALEGFSECMAVSQRHFNIWVSCVQPGPVKTMIEHNPDMSDTLLAQVDDHGTDEKTRELFRERLEVRKQMHGSEAQPVEEVTDIVEEIVDDEKPHLRYQTSERVRAMARDRFRDPDGDDWVNSFYSTEHQHS